MNEHLLFYLLIMNSFFIFNALFYFWLCQVAARGTSCCGKQALQRMGSVAVARSLSCPAVCVLLVPRPGIERVSPALESGFSTTGPPGKSLIMNSLFWILTFSAQFRWWLQEPPHYSTDHLVGLWTLDTSCNTLPWLCLVKRKATNIQPKPWNLFSGGFMHWTNEFTNLCGFLNCKLLHVRVVNSHASCHIRILN